MYIKIACSDINRRGTSLILEATADFTSVNRLECFFKQKYSDQLIGESPPEIPVGRP